ncbi:glutaredoxin family protein, partial [Staphylococcus epidermidis]
MTDTVIIYTQDDCPPCAFIKNYLVNKNIKFTEKNIKNQKYKNEMMDYDAFATPF